MVCKVCPQNWVLSITQSPILHNMLYILHVLEFCLREIDDSTV